MQERSRRQSLVQRVGRDPLQVQWLGEQRCCTGVTGLLRGGAPDAGNGAPACAAPNPAHNSEAKTVTKHFTGNSLSSVRPAQRCTV
jgi:hypothetical protein